MEAGANKGGRRGATGYKRGHHHRIRQWRRSRPLDGRREEGGGDGDGVGHPVRWQGASSSFMQVGMGACKELAREVAAATERSDGDLYGLLRARERRGEE